MDRLVEIATFGCKVNSYDTGLLQKQLVERGFQLHGESRPESETGGLERSSPMIHVLNTCAVTAEATSQALRQARRLKRQNPDCIVVVTGCSAQVDTEKFADQSHVDLVVANSHKGELGARVQDFVAGIRKQKIFKSNIFRKDDLEGGGGLERHHTRSFLKIQDGCNSFCTFCVIPFARGKSRSLEPQELVQRINDIHRDGVCEVVLTGVHIGDYISANGWELADLVEFILDHTTIPRLRLSSLEPMELSAKLLRLYTNPRLCPHFHMSIQSGSTSVLRRMKRKYSAEQVQEALHQIEVDVPGAFVGMDVIAGFPEESEAEAEETLQNLARWPWTRLHVFPYSARPLTYAAKAFSELPGSTIKARARQLRELSRDRLNRAASAQMGKLKKVLVLGARKDPVVALSRDYWSVAIDGLLGDYQGQELEVLVTGADREDTRPGELLLYARVPGPVVSS